MHSGVEYLYKSSPALYQMDDEYDGFEWVQLMK